MSNLSCYGLYVRSFLVCNLSNRSQGPNPKPHETRVTGAVGTIRDQQQEYNSGTNSFLLVPIVTRRQWNLICAQNPSVKV
jgi:hypothetical protein